MPGPVSSGPMPKSIAARRLCGLGMAMMLLATAGQADDAPVPPAPPLTPPEITLFNFGVNSPACLTWTNACQICTRLPDGKPGCSTPGIACTPVEPVCAAPKQP